MDTSSSSLTAVTEKRQDDRPDALSVNYVNEGNDPLTSSRTTLVDYVKDKGDICLFDSSGKQVRDLIKCGWSLLDFIPDIQRRDLKEDSAIKRKLSVTSFQHASRLIQSK